MEIIKKFFIIVLVLSLMLQSASAEEPAEAPAPETPETTEESPLPSLPLPVAIRLSISTNSASIYDNNISVSACNNDNGATEEMRATAYCAILQSGISSDWNWAWAPGAFLNSLNGIEGFTSQDEGGNDVYHFWSWYLNGSEAMTAMNQYELSSGDRISLKFIEPELPAPAPSSGGSSGGSRSKNFSKNEQVLGDSTKQSFNSGKTLGFLVSQQKENGSFGAEMYTDWAAIGIASADTGSFGSAFRLIKYFSESTYEPSNLTDYERRAMALMSLGLNPYNTNGINYIEKITSSFDGKQLGDLNEDNDDIFGVLVLGNAGYGYEDAILKNSLSFILDRQRADGSWDGSVDMTGAALQVLASYSSNSEKIQDSLIKAKGFLKKAQSENGGWNDSVSSTAWALGGISALGEKNEDWTKGSYSPADFLTSKQDADGGIKEEDKNNRIWQSSYALAAISGKTWPELMQRFAKADKKMAPQKTPAPIRKTPAIKASEKPEAAAKLSSLAADEITAQSEAGAQAPAEIKTSSKTSWIRKMFGSLFGF